ncbi:MAG: hypothetical protein S4CHLAM102_06380 [Chlamydiia bacterium]|nr:hypothetical protein [Chlamydiia bacterium]
MNAFKRLLYLFSSMRAVKKENKHLQIAENHPRADNQRPFVILIPSFNNAGVVAQNLLSALNQEYKNYHIIYINDDSNDFTLENAKHAIAHHPKKHLVRFISNKKNQGALKNCYDVIHTLDNEKIVILLDGDDWFAHENVLQYLNGLYQDPLVWLTYGQYTLAPHFALGNAKPLSIKELREAKVRQYRSFTFKSHLKSFYAGLFKRIRKEDLLYDNEFFPVAADCAMMLPMIEMAREHVYFIKDPLYVYNTENPFPEEKHHPGARPFYLDYIQSLKVYERLFTHPKNPIVQ